MKFSYTLQFNTIPEWADHYMAYSCAKKLIFQLEKERVQCTNKVNDIEHGSSANRQRKEEDRFIQFLEQQLKRINDFYIMEEKRIFSNIKEVTSAVNELADITQTHYQKEERSVVCSDFPLVEVDLSHHEIQPTEIDHTMARQTSQRSVESQSSLESSTNTSSLQHMVDLRSSILDVFVDLSKLISFVDTNRLAFHKLLKHYKKILAPQSCQHSMENKIDTEYIFLKGSLEHLDHQLHHLENIYAAAFYNGDSVTALQYMKSHLRQHTTTTWSNTTDKPQKPTSLHGKLNQASSHLQIPFFHQTLHREALRSAGCFLLSIVSLIVLLNVDCFNDRQENHCFALLVFSAIMWATEAVPLYATSLMIPFLVVLLSILKDDQGHAMHAKPAAKAVFSSMFSGTIMMLLGGFSLATALSKYRIAKAFASHILSYAGTRPRWVLLVNMLVAAFLSMWISNVATPVLCFSLVGPILRTLPHHSRVAPCLLLGIALASCIGGMTSPISSPQNIVTLQYLEASPGWGTWFIVALPVSFLSLLVAWGILLLVYRPDQDTPCLATIQPIRGSPNQQQCLVLFVTLVTIGLWCAESVIADYVGDPGIVAALPLFFFFGTRLLGKEDLNAFLWSVVVLAQGGMALGYAVTSSGLLKDIALHIKTHVQSLSVGLILSLFCVLVLVVSTFVSHTVAALIILPIVKEVGSQLPVPHANLLVMGAGLACSAGMGLPVSGFPNMSAIMQENALGKPYLSTRDFVMAGVPTSIVCTLFVCTLGYLIMQGVGY
ncbi:Sodium:sulfate symporter transmembrane region-domain-containing protein [Spinellus fusiger]|nr:Sodium:sulfate symporter transmembrane region-domain-containing protein [Spinellus fusiger]